LSSPSFLNEAGQALHAGLLGLAGGSALLLGAAAGFWLRVPQRAVAAVMAFGAGVLISLVAFDLLDKAYAGGGLAMTAAGFGAGAALFTLCNILIIRQGGHHRKRSGCNPCARQDPKAGLAIAAGALLDGVPESFVIGVGSIHGTQAAAALVAAFFLANIPEGLSSAAGMRQAGHGRAYVFGVWGAIAVASGVAATAGHFALANAHPGVVAVSLSVAAGAILAMVIDTMIPEAADEAHDYTGLIGTAGFMTAFLITKMLS